MMTPVTCRIASEQPHEHWQFAHVAQKRVLDLGCGNFNTLLHDDTSDSLGYFLAQGASFVLGIDNNPKDVAYLHRKYADAIAAGRADIRCQRCDTVQDLDDLIRAHQIQVVKSDIEGFEFLLEWLPETTVAGLDACYIEAHGGNLLRSIPTWASHQGFVLAATIELAQATNYPCSVYFFERPSAMENL